MSKKIEFLQSEYGISDMLWENHCIPIFNTFLADKFLDSSNKMAGDNYVKVKQGYKP
jgi:hypothetical protein